MLAIRLLKHNDENIQKNIQNIINERDKIKQGLQEVGIECIKSNSNILMTKTIFSKSFMKKLESKGIRMVPIYDELNNLHFRVAVQDFRTNEQFIDSIKDIMTKNRRRI